MMQQLSPAPNTSPDGTAITRKRKRKTYSCIDCRRRKLKCDREQPCGRCVKESHPQTCTFNSEGVPDWNGSEADEQDNVFRTTLNPTDPKHYGSNQPINGVFDSRGTANSNPTEIITALRRKVEYLEFRLAAVQSTSNNNHHVNTVSTVDSESNRLGNGRKQESNARYFVGTAFETHFYGPTVASAMLLYFPEVHAFTQDPGLLQTPIARIQKELQAMRARGKERRRQNQRAEENLFALLPSREVMDRRVRLYFDTYDHVYRVLHQPTFWAEFSNGDTELWQDSFVAIVLLILASVSCLATNEFSFREDNSVARETAERWVVAVECWHSRQSQKNRTLQFFQVQYLLLLAKRNNVIKRKRAWMNSGNLLRTAVSAGMHLEPSEVHKGGISIFDQEMRRRIWACIFEWDLDASTARGVPPVAASIPSDCLPPLNVNDEDFGKGSQELPTAQPLSEQTSNSFICISLQSLPLRVSLTSSLNDLNGRLSFEEVLQREAQINQALDALPDRVKQSNVRKCYGLPSVFQATTLENAILDIQLRQYLIFLHNPFTRTGSSSQRSYSRIACINAASEILEFHFKLAAAGNHALSLQDHGLFCSILTLSLNMLMELQSPTLSKCLAVSQQTIADKALSVLEDKVLRLGEWYEVFWLATAAFSFASCKLEGNTEEARDKAVDRIVKLYYKVLAFQTKQHPSPPANQTQTPLPSVSALTPTQPDVGPSPYPSLDKPELPPLLNMSGQIDFTALNGLPEWELEDLWGFDSINL